MTAQAATFPRELVFEVFCDLARRFDPEPWWDWSGEAETEPVPCPHARAERLCAVGGFRRRKAAMKDLELLYIPRVREVEDPSDLFGGRVAQDVTERLLDELLALGVLRKRLNVNGHESAWGRWNKHAEHVATGLPIDLFAATRENYFNRLVVTTGPRESNVAIATAARKLGYEWEVNEAGFVPTGGTWETSSAARKVMRSEREVFEFVGLPFLPPEERR